MPRHPSRNDTKEVSSFSEEKEAKRLYVSSVLPGWNGEADIKVFWFFSSEKNMLSCLSASKSLAQTVMRLPLEGLLEVRMCDGDHAVHPHP
jgi:hypothetical protein